MVVIYGLRNTVNGKSYVGCTRNAGKRLREHRCLLRAGEHQCKSLQADWSAFGEATFRMVVLEELGDNVAVDRKRERELWWMDAVPSYNEGRVSFQPPPDAPALAAKARVANGYRPSAESNLKRSIAQLGVPKGHGAKISATKRAQREAKR